MWLMFVNKIKHKLYEEKVPTYTIDPNAPTSHASTVCHPRHFLSQIAHKN